MKLRAPAIPLITVDPYFSVWSAHEKLNYMQTRHWTGEVNSIVGCVFVDGERRTFLGYEKPYKKMVQTEMDIDALSTRYTFEGLGIRLFVRFTTPLLMDDLAIMTRPVSYMSISYESTDGKAHEVEARVTASESLCLNKAHERPIVREEFAAGGVSGMRMFNKEQAILNRSGDDLRINWGYFYLGVVGEATERGNWRVNGFEQIAVRCKMVEGEERLYLFAYDDVKSINYFGKQLSSYWNKDGKDIYTAMAEAARDWPEISVRCDDFSDKLVADAYMAGGEKYADLLSLSYRQAIAAHKVAVDENGDVLFISKECFSNGCAATVDVSYPSIPIFLLYNTELVKGMMRPIYKFAASDAWKYDYAPHDAGQYPLVTGQVYGLDRATGELKHDMQMPVEECGNMIIMEANVAIADGNADFAASHIDTLRDWCRYLIEYGDDPENQLCTDDFAGHLAHNCNLSLKAIMGIRGMAIIEEMLGNSDVAEKYKEMAKEKAAGWIGRAANGDGSFRLAFDLPGSRSMKYNMVWDKIWGTGLFPTEVYESEVAAYFEDMNEYGLPLDSRADYTKSDWYLWCATLTKSVSEFKRFIAPLWKAYNETTSRVPMTDWYDTVSGLLCNFINRTVIGGLYIKLLDASGKMELQK